MIYFKIKYEGTIRDIEVISITKEDGTTWEVVKALSEGRGLYNVKPYVYIKASLLTEGINHFPPYNMIYEIIPQIKPKLIKEYINKL